MPLKNEPPDERESADDLGFWIDDELIDESCYCELVIVGSSPLSEIWLADDGGHLVQMETGELRTSVLRGNYVVTFGLKASAYPIALQEPRHFTQGQLESGPTCPVPIPRLLDE